ncbi:MAG: 16S rRNA (cytidine(1402)-2'-O)-methyltransferase [Hyphomicrobium sp.]
MSSREREPEGTVARTVVEMQRHLDEDLAPGLYLVATPIGSLGDITLRALSVLSRAEVILCEDTRHSRILLAHYGVATPTRPYHEHNAARERPRVLADLQAGRRVALISDAGTPLISDPGLKLVRAALDAGHRVECLPGASATLAALSVAGLPTDAFFFAGFLPTKAAARRARIAELKDIPSTLVFFEAPSRVAETLVDLGAELGARPAAIARELTKLHEEVRRALLSDLAASVKGETIKGEVVIVVGPPQREEVTDAVITAQLQGALEDASLRDASKAIAEALGVPKTRVYDLGLRLTRGDT